MKTKVIRAHGALLLVWCAGRAGFSVVDAPQGARVRVGASALVARVFRSAAALRCFRRVLSASYRPDLAHAQRAPSAPTAGSTGATTGANVAHHAIQH